MQYYMCNDLNPTQGQWFKRRGSPDAASSSMPGFVERLTEDAYTRRQGDSDLNIRLLSAESVPLRRDGRPGLRQQTARHDGRGRKGSELTGNTRLQDVEAKSQTTVLDREDHCIHSYTPSIH